MGQDAIHVLAQLYGLRLHAFCGRFFPGKNERSAATNSFAFGLDYGIGLVHGKREWRVQVGLPPDLIHSDGILIDRTPWESNHGDHHERQHQTHLYGKLTTPTLAHGGGIARLEGTSHGTYTRLQEWQTLHPTHATTYAGWIARIRWLP